MSRVIGSWVRLAALLGSVCAASAGCTPRPASPPPSTATASTESRSDPDDITAGLVESHRFHHHGGTTLFLAMSLDTLGVSAEQQVAVDGIRRALYARMEPARLAEQRLLGVLADGLAAGRIDDARVDAAMVEVRAAAGVARDASADEMNALHAALDPVERAALVDKIEAHWRVWQQANLDDRSPTPQDLSSLAMMTEDLRLTSDETEKIRAGLGERMNRVTPLVPGEVERDIESFGDAFRRDTFDAKTTPPSGLLDARLAGWGAAHLANLVEAAVLVLTVEQRAQLAQLLREHTEQDAVATVAP